MSAETLNFGPQWLRDLSGGPGGGASSSPVVGFPPASKFELAEHRYGREEMLALFNEDTEIPDELLRAPSLLLEVPQLPLALKPETNSLQSGGYRGRGGITTNSRGRSIPARGRGRGRGATWEDHDENARKPPLLRRAESEDWRSDSLRGKGDGAEDVLNGIKEWRISGPRRDPLKDSWRERATDGRDIRPFRNRSVSAKESDESSTIWADDYKPSDTNRDPPAKLHSEIERLDADLENRRKHRETEPKTTDNRFQESQSTEENPTEPDPIQEPEVQVQQMPKIPEMPEAPPDKPNTSVTAEYALANFETNEIAHRKEALQSVQTSVENATTNEVIPNNQSQFEDLLRTSVNNAVTSSFMEVQTPMSQPMAPSNNAGVPAATFTSKSASPIAQLQTLATTWFYKDPQGDTQGPFSSSQMMEWFNAGYFTMVLRVRRACDQQYVPLGEMIKKWGCVPFRPAGKNVENGAGESGQPAIVQHIQQEQMQYQQIQRPQEIPKRTYKQNNIEVMIANLMKTNEFRSMSPQHQQQYVTMVFNQLQQQNHNQLQNVLSNDVTPDRLQQPGGQQTQFDMFEQEPQNPNVFHTDLMQSQAKAIEEKRRKEEEAIQKIKREQEEEKEKLRRQEEELRKRKEMLLREEEEMKRLHMEAQKKKQELEQQEALKRRLEEERRRKEQEELMRIRRMEEEAQRRLEQIAKQEALKRKLQEEQLRKEHEERRKAEEEWRRKVEEEQRRRKAEEEEAQRRQEEEEQKRLEKQRQEEARKLELQNEAARKLKEKAEQEERERRMLQERQMQQMQLPSSALWGNKMQPHPPTDTSMSLLEIQQLQQQHEQTMQKEKEQMRMEHERQRPQKPKSGWGAPVAINPGQRSHPSLLEIQRQEAEQMASVKPPTKTENAAAFSFNTSWNKPLKIQSETPKKNPSVDQANFWDQVVEESSTKKPPQKKQQSLPKGQPKPSNVKQKKTKVTEESQVKALFQQQLSRDCFSEWCEDYLQRMNAGYIDIPTFVNFLRDVESPFEVEEYVQSYLGETREAREFAKLFLEKRKGSGASQQTPANKVSNNSKGQSGPSDADGFVFVTGNSKRSKKKLRKLQKVDPSILGFSVNAASDRVNMGEIQTADD